jgi:hypothetical protein
LFWFVWHEEMGVMRAVKGAADTVGEFVSRQEPIGRDDALFTMQPLGLSEPMRLHLL